ncbi:hypothetical protein CJF31_00001133 [Rutstroemia sp. NJR-2017a BVV2]|nr:hypothetical protein CJF31_00001133 [Rutstroemia sp. NJR-2017a BVV2]
MSSTLTLDHIHAIMDPIDQGDWSKFYAAIDENVRWWIGADEYDPNVATGVYVRRSTITTACLSSLRSLLTRVYQNLQEWTEKVRNRLMPRLDGGVTMKSNTMDIIGQKAIIEASGTAKQKNGKPYNNRFCWIFIFNEAGKIVEIREYLNTALVKEVLTTN